MLNIDAIPDLVFDPRSRRWRYRDSQKFASMESIRNLSKKYNANQKSELQRLGSDYSSGKIDIKQFQVEAAKLLKSLHLSAMIQGLDKQNDMKPERFLAVGRNLKSQYYSGKDPLTGDRFGLKYLVQDMVEGNVSSSRLQSRLKMFGESDKVSLWDTRKAIALDNGIQYGRRVLGATENCQQCGYYAGLGVIPLRDIVLPATACQCRTNCKCRIEFIEKSKKRSP
jgi:hypothetical protein